MKIIRNSRPNRAVIYVMLILGAVALGAVGCADGDHVDPKEGAERQSQAEYRDSLDGSHADHHNPRTLIIDRAESAERYFSSDGVATLEYPDPFQQVGMQIDAESLENFSFRVPRAGGEWTQWEPVDVYWNEGKMHNAHVLLDEPTEVIELRGAKGLEFAKFEYFEEVVARDEIVTPDRPPELAPRDPALADSDPIDVMQQAVAPNSMVTTRHQWGAISPDKICGSVVDPYRASIHHTAVPDSDGGDPHARMRGMQSYHINSNNWCDIGYHFVVAQSGEIMQGRSRSNRPAAHVGGQNHGNVGISMIGNYNSASPPSIQIEKTGQILGWVHDTHNIALNRDAVRGHREWPGQTTSCPGTAGLSHVEQIIDHASSGGGTDPPPDPEYDVALSIHVHDLDNFYEQGTSSWIYDAFAGREFRAEIRVTNQSTEAIREVALGYAFDSVGLEVLDYQIDTDHPEYDKNSWTVNSANDAPENPASDALGQQGELIMHAFSPNETKRVLVDLKATQYNIGFNPFPEAGIQAWMIFIEDVYGPQSSYEADPETNNVGEFLRSYKRIDILSRDEWQFRSKLDEDLEGWTAEGPYERLAINANDDAMALLATGSGAAVVSPSWTRVDADTYDELVIRSRSHDGPHHKVLYWKREGESFGEHRAIEFQSIGDGDYHTQVVSLADHPQWSGEIKGLRLVQPQDLSPGEDDSGWYDIDHLYFQDQSAGITSSQTLGVISTSDDGSESDGEVDNSDQDPDAPGAPDGDDVDGDRDGTGAGPGGRSGWPGVTGEASSDDDIEVHSSGCAATDGGHGPSNGWLMVLLVIGLVTLRRSDRA